MHGGDPVHKHASDVCFGDGAFDAIWLLVAFNPLERQGDWRVVADVVLPRLQDVVRLSAAPHVMLLIVLLLCLGSYQFVLFPGECAKCAVVERHVHKEGHLGVPAEPRVDTT
jgi:hypothetical protein